jgi:hypothetical protein
MKSLLLNIALQSNVNPSKNQLLNSNAVYYNKYSSKSFFLQLKCKYTQKKKLHLIFQF